MPPKKKARTVIKEIAEPLVRIEYCDRSVAQQPSTSGTNDSTLPEAQLEDALALLGDSCYPEQFIHWANSDSEPIDSVDKMLNSSNENIKQNHRAYLGTAPHTAVAQTDGNAVLVQQRRSSMDPNATTFHQNPSPPSQTDSSTSAGSPSSGSDHSPCPGSEHLAHQGVIQPPSQHQILGVQSQMHELVNGQRWMMNDPLLQAGVPVPHFTQQYFHPHTPGSLAQVSPPSGSTAGLGSPGLGYWPPQQMHEPDNGCFSNGERTHKRMRSAGFPKQDPSSPRISEDSPDYMDYNNPQQCIHFNEFETEKWHALCDGKGQELKPFGFHVVADKGFNFSPFDTAFVNQKKNHFQVSVHIENFELNPPEFLRVREGNQVTLKPLNKMRVQEGSHWVDRAEFRLSFYGVKSEMTSSKVAIRQSQTDRKPVDYEPVKLACPESKVTKVTVARLHFSETTMNNQRKNGRPNPDQKYLNLAVVLQAVINENEIYPVMAFASDKVIVRASNPGQFDNGESEVHWQKGANGYGNFIYHPGSVCIGTDKPEGQYDPNKNALTVGGNIYCTGAIQHPSDRRFKQNVEDVDKREALTNICNTRIVRYEIRPEYCEEWKLDEDQRHKIGVIAQELQETIPDAVRQHGEFLAVDDSRIFYEQTAAVQELHRLTEQLDYKVSEAHADVENINKKFRRLCRLKNLPSLRSTASSHESGVNCSTSYLSRSLSSLGSATPKASRKKLDDPEVQFTSNRRGRYQCENACQIGSNGLVNNRIVQWACVALVGIIAFCLIAMTTLYIMDWKSNRELKERTELTFGPTLSPTKDQGPGEIVELNNVTIDNEWKPPDWVIQPPALYPCASRDCDLFCCPKSQFKYKMESKGENGDGDIKIVPLATEATKIGDRVKRKSEFDTVKEMVGKDFLPGTSKVGPVEMEVVGLNQTIGREYCMSKACNDPKGGNYTFYIPVSEYMPMISLEIMFHIKDKRTVSHCGGVNDEMCDDLKRDTSNTPSPLSVVQGDGMPERESEVFYLPVGFYTRSHYKFRIGDSTTSCLASASDVGQLYDEYNLIFYRVCSV